jgi:putative membrane protein
MIGTALAHDGLFEAHGRLTLASAWTLDPLVLVPLALAAWLYGRGSLRAGLREACFAGGLASLFFALVWPLDALGERLFSAHMAQHLVLMNVAAPLVVLGAPLAAMLRALPQRARRALARLGANRRWRAGWHAASSLVAATAAQQAVLWIWHTPGGIAAALESEPVHIAMHASLIAAALVFWTAVLRPASGKCWGSIAALLVTLKVSGVVCIALLIRGGTLYPAYGEAAAAWGLTPAEDEGIGWGLMMTSGTATYLAAALALAWRALASLERAHSGRGRPA